MYYDITTDTYTTSIPSGSRGSEWVQVYSKTKKALTLEDLKQLQRTIFLKKMRSLTPHFLKFL